jgi:F0F1-type ATP synthase assembly protein I
VPKPWKEYGRYGSVGLELILSMAVGYFLGRWIDRRFFHEAGWATGIGALLGVYAGFRTLFRTAKRMQQDVEDAERMERGEDPWADGGADEPSPPAKPRKGDGDGVP